MKSWSTALQRKMQDFLAKLLKQNNEIQVVMTVPEEKAK